MNSASTAEGGEISRSGKCVRVVQLGDKSYKVLHAWELHSSRGLKLTSGLVRPGRSKPEAKQSRVVYVANSASALAVKAAAQAESLMENTRQVYLRAHPAAAVVVAAKRGREVDELCPITQALYGRKRTRASPTPPAKPAVAQVRNHRLVCTVCSPSLVGSTHTSAARTAVCGGYRTLLTVLIERMIAKLPAGLLLHRSILACK